MAFDFAGLPGTPQQSGQPQIRYYAKVKADGTQKRTRVGVTEPYGGQQIKNQRQYASNHFQLRATFAARIGYRLF
jgi:hypothetical protein